MKFITLYAPASLALFVALTVFVMRSKQNNEQTWGLLTGLAIGLSIGWLVWAIVALGAVHATWLIPIWGGVLGLFWFYKNKKGDTNKYLRLSDISDALAIDSTGKDQVRHELHFVRDVVEDIVDYGNQITLGEVYIDADDFTDRHKLALHIGETAHFVSQQINEFVETVSQVADGNLQSRISTENKKGYWLEFASEFNTYLDSVSEPLLKINGIIHAMSEGDFTQRFSSEGKGAITNMGNNLNLAQDKIEGIFHQINQSVGYIEESASEMQSTGAEMSETTDEISSSISQITLGAQNQVNKIDETSSLIEHIGNSSNDMAGLAQAIHEAARKGGGKGDEGVRMIEEITSGIESLQLLSNSTRSTFESLRERANEVSRILSLINEITNQSNMLALNAAIEAAQAGDAGRGFAVVAEELRKLADNSKQSLGNVRALIDGVQTESEKAVVDVDAMIKGIQDSVALSQSAKSSFGEIQRFNNETLTRSKEIVQATESQNEMITLIISNTESIVVIAEESAAGSEQVAASAAELASGMMDYRSKAEHLSGIATNFKTSLQSLQLSDKAAVSHDGLSEIQKAFEREKYLLNALLTNTNDYIYFKNLKSEFIRVSHSMAKIAKVSDANSLLGMTDFDLFGEHARKAYNDEQEIIKTGQPLLNYVEHQDDKDGSESYVSTSKMALKDQAGKIVGTFGVSRDITELKLKEIEVSSKMEELAVCKEENSKLKAKLAS